MEYRRQPHKDLGNGRRLRHRAINMEPAVRRALDKIREEDEGAKDGIVVRDEDLYTLADIAATLHAIWSEWIGQLLEECESSGGGIYRIGSRQSRALKSLMNKDFWELPRRKQLFFVRTVMKHQGEIVAGLETLESVSGKEGFEAWEGSDEVDESIRE